MKRKVGWPKYMREKRLASGVVSYFWEPPSWARKHESPCPFGHESLGADYETAKARCDKILNPSFDEWRANKDVPEEQRVRPATIRRGSMLWLAEEFKVKREYLRVSELTQEHYRGGLKAVCEFRLRHDGRGRAFGDLDLGTITAEAADTLYDALREARGDRAAAKAMQAARRAWFVMARREPDLVPQVNPFSKMGIEFPTEGGAKPASFAELHAFMTAAHERGHPSLAAAALIGWEWFLREIDIVSKLSWSHYRPPEKPGYAYIRHNKNKSFFWTPVDDDQGEPIYPELDAVLEQLTRRGTLVIMRDRPARDGQFKPYTREDFSKQVRKVLDGIGLHHLTFASFRKGGETEMGDADLTDQQMMALDGHKSRTVLPTYVATNRQQRIEAALKRRQHRTNRGQLSERTQDICRNANGSQKR